MNEQQITSIGLRGINSPSHGDKECRNVCKSLGKDGGIFKLQKLVVCTAACIIQKLTMKELQLSLMYIK